VVVWISTFAVSYLTTTRARAGAGHLLVVYAVGAGCVLFSLGVTAPMFVGAVMSPIRDLARGTSEVASGRLGTRVPVTSTDELGQLATSFNHMVDELQASRARVVAAGDTARRQVERDLHDGAQQRLVLIRLKLNLLKRDPTRLDLIDELTSELDQALAELRDLARGLYPARLESDGLPGALADVAERAPIPTAIESNGTGRMPPQVEAAVYFCCLEALQNAAKHAGPSATARISVTTTGSTLSFEIADDGAGFDPATARAGGSGLQNMSDRVGALGGNVRVDSAPGGGTKVVGTIPIPDATRG
jgi:signal transduction histidine kinase